MRKVFIPDPIQERVFLSKEDSYHIIQVLRHAIGDSIQVTDGTGATYEMEITAYTQGQVEVRQGKLISKAKPSVPLVLAAGLLKSDKFEWVLQKTTELGISGIIPLKMRHCVVKIDDKKWADRKKRWERIVMEAAKQCGRNEVPWIGDMVTIEELLLTYKEYSYLVPYEQEKEGALKAALQNNEEPMMMIIGPEGGFAKEEIEHIVTAGGNKASLVSLGSRILRAETAAIAVTAMAVYERGFR